MGVQHRRRCSTLSTPDCQQLGFLPAQAAARPLGGVRGRRHADHEYAERQPVSNQLSAGNANVDRVHADETVQMSIVCNAVLCARRTLILPPRSDVQALGVRPRLQLNGKPFQFVGDDSKLFKFLGRLMEIDLKTTHARAALRSRLVELLELVDKTLHGWQKAWLYNHYVVSKLSWMLMVYELPLSYLDTLEEDCTRKLKKWVGLARSGATGVMYLPRSKRRRSVKRSASTRRRQPRDRSWLICGRWRCRASGSSGSCARRRTCRGGG